MAIVRVSKELLAEMLFGYSELPVSIGAVRDDPFCDALHLEISGPDVPDAPEVRAIFIVTQNRRGEKLHTLKFEPVVV